MSDARHQLVKFGHPPRSHNPSYASPLTSHINSYNLVEFRHEHTAPWSDLGETWSRSRRTSAARRDGSGPRSSLVWRPDGCFSPGLLTTALGGPSFLCLNRILRKGVSGLRFGQLSGPSTCRDEADVVVLLPGRLGLETSRSLEIPSEHLEQLVSFVLWP